MISQKKIPINEDMTMLFTYTFCEKKGKFIKNLVLKYYNGFKLRYLETLSAAVS